MFLERDTKMDTPLRTVRPNIVQSIRAFRVPELQDAATELGQHFLYANLSSAQSKQDVLDMIAAQYTFPAHFGKNFDALYDCMTDLVHKSGQQPGFIVVLEQIPANAKFDKEAREQLLDIFRDAADYWADRKILSCWSCGFLTKPLKSRSMRYRPRRRRPKTNRTARIAQ